MARLSISTAFVVLAFALGARAAIGPVTDLHIVNANINPDGNLARDAVLAEGGFPGPLITGNKVRVFGLTFIYNDIKHTSVRVTTSRSMSLISSPRARC